MGKSKKTMRRIAMLLVMCLVPMFLTGCGGLLGGIARGAGAIVGGAGRLLGGAVRGVGGLLFGDRVGGGEFEGPIGGGLPGAVGFGGGDFGGELAGPVLGGGGDNGCSS